VKKRVPVCLPGELFQVGLDLGVDFDLVGAFTASG